MNDHGIKTQTRVVDTFVADDMGAPFQIILKNSVEVTFDEEGHQTAYKIPDPKGLERLIVVARVAHHRKMNGAEIKYLRKLVNIKQQELASHISLSVEHLSKVENGHNVLSPIAEKVARVFLLKTAIKLQNIKSDIKRIRLEEALDEIFYKVDPVAACSADERLVFSFCRENKVDVSNDNDGLWKNGAVSVGREQRKAVGMS